MKRHTLALIVLLLSFFYTTLTAQVVITLPDDYDSLDSYVGKTVELRQRMYVVDNNDYLRYGELTLASERLMSPTDVALPGSADYFALVAHNRNCCICIDDGSKAQYPSPLPWASADGTLRTGSYTDCLKGRLTYEQWGRRWVYVITPERISDIQFQHNSRPTTPESHTDEYDVTICGFNLEYYITDQFADNLGPSDAAQHERQHTKIAAALHAINADIYGLVEVQQGTAAAQKIVDELNRNNNNCHYAYIHDGTAINGTWTRACFIYRDDILVPIRNQQVNDTGVRYRKKVQGFELKQNGERFIVMLGHFKAKSGNGTGDNTDKGDGQGIYNGDRTREAAAMITLSRSCIDYYSDPDIVMIGDLNSYSLEDPIRTFTDAGYTNMIKHFGGNGAYSYRYHEAVGCLDHALVNESMMPQVAYCTSFHINADEPSGLEYDSPYYQPNMYRSSDHDPIVLDIKLDGSNTSTNSPLQNSPIVYLPEQGIIGIAGATERTLQIIVSDGRIVATHHISSPDYTFTTSNLTKGIYLLRIVSQTETTTHKVVI